MKKLLLSLAIATALAGCDKPSSTETATTGAYENAPSVSAKKAELGEFGLELDVRDLSIQPGDDFFRYAGGKWLEEFEIPSDRTSYGAFTTLRIRTDEQVKDIFDDLASAEPNAGTLEAKLADYYASYMDADGVNEKGIDPLKPILSGINGISNFDELVAALGRAGIENTSSPINVFIGVDRKNPDVYRVNMGAGGIGLPDKDYYLQDSERFNMIREKYVAHIQTMLEFLNVDSAAEKAQSVFELETSIAEKLWDRADRRNRDKTYNPYKRSGMNEAFPNFNWDAYFDSAGLVEFADLNVSHPSAFEPLINLVHETPIETWKAYLSFHLITNHASLLSDEIRLENFEFFGKTLRGQPEPRARWEQAIQQVAGRGQRLGEAIGQIYVQRHFTPDAKAQMDDLVENLRIALGLRIDALDWMGDETKVEAREKLANFTPRIGYPDDWQDFSSIELTKGDLFGNVTKVREFFINRSLSRLNQPTNKTEWRFNTPQTVNASYNPAFNQITFPAGILQPPFFDPAADPAVNYGAIGAVIGHEMGHGFDDQGSKSDAYGIQRNWWTDEDRARFEERATALAEQYNQYAPIPGNFVDGRFTLGENIGDLGGLSMAYHAYKLSLNGEEAPVLGGLTGDQRFFLAWAQIWRAKSREATALARLKSDPHSPSEFRVNGVVRNMDEWYEAFNVTPEHALYLPPEERVKIW